MARPNAPDTRSHGDRTRLTLIEAGLTLFGEKGYAATSTRELATMAGANIASIAYHFGGKEGLRDACAEHIVAMVRQVSGPLLAMPLPARPEDAETQLRMMVRQLAGFLLTSPEAGRFVAFVLHEMQYPTRALDILYAAVFEPVHRRLCAVWGVATGEEAESEAVRIALFTMVGQVVYFRIGREAVMRRMGWQRIGPEEAERIAAVALDNLEVVLAARRKRAP